MTEVWWRVDGWYLFFFDGYGELYDTYGPIESEELANEMAEIFE